MCNLNQLNPAESEKSPLLREIEIVKRKNCLSIVFTLKMESEKI